LSNRVWLSKLLEGAISSRQRFPVSLRASVVRSERGVHHPRQANRNGTEFALRLYIEFVIRTSETGARLLYSRRGERVPSHRAHVPTWSARPCSERCLG